MIYREYSLVASNGKESACKYVGDLSSISGSGRSPGEGNGYSLQYSCLENSMDRGAWQATVYGVAKGQTQLSDWACTHLFGGFPGGSDCQESACQENWVQSLDQEDPLEKEMAMHSSILAWRIPWREEPGGLPSMVSQRVRHDWSNLATHTCSLASLNKKRK